MRRLLPSSGSSWFSGITTSLMLSTPSQPGARSAMIATWRACASARLTGCTSSNPSCSTEPSSVRPK
jgi:hypothetical protein